jgi:transposase
MGRRRRETLRPLRAAEHRALTRRAQARSERVDRVARAVALLAVAEERPYTQAGWRSHVRVAKLVRRFQQRGLAAVEIAPGRGRRATSTLPARTQVVAVAQQAPDRRTDQTATWSLATLQRQLRRAGLPRIGATPSRRVLQDAGSNYQRTRTWCPTGTARRTRKAGVVQVVDAHTEETKA